MLRIAVGIIDEIAATIAMPDNTKGRRINNPTERKTAMPHAGSSRRLNALLAVINAAARIESQSHWTRLVSRARKANSNAAIGQSAQNISLPMLPAWRTNPYPAGKIHIQK